MGKRTWPPVTSLDGAVDAFIEGARLHHAGAYVQSSQMAIDGILRTNEGVDFIDAHAPDGRDLLLPLLEHDEDVVQITAASALIPSHLDRAIATIRRVHETSITEAFGSAVMIITTRDVMGDFEMGLCSFDPRYPRPTKRPASMIGPRFKPPYTPWKVS